MERGSPALKGFRFDNLLLIFYTCRRGQNSDRRGDKMVWEKLFGSKENSSSEEGTGNVVIRVEVGGKTYVRRYADLESAQLRFPQYLADLAALQTRQDEDER